MFIHVSDTDNSSPMDLALAMESTMMDIQMIAMEADTNEASSTKKFADRVKAAIAKLKVAMTAWFKKVKEFMNKMISNIGFQLKNMGNMTKEIQLLGTIHTPVDGIKETMFIVNRIKPRFDVALAARTENVTSGESHTNQYKSNDEIAVILGTNDMKTVYDRIRKAFNGDSMYQSKKYRLDKYLKMYEEARTGFTTLEKIYGMTDDMMTSLMKYCDTVKDVKGDGQYEKYTREAIDTANTVVTIMKQIQTVATASLQLALKEISNTLNQVKVKHTEYKDNDAPKVTTESSIYESIMNTIFI